MLCLLWQPIVRPAPLGGIRTGRRLSLLAPSPSAISHIRIPHFIPPVVLCEAAPNGLNLQFLGMDIVAIFAVPFGNFPVKSVSPSSAVYIIGYEREYLLPSLVGYFHRQNSHPVQVLLGLNYLKGNSTDCCTIFT